MFIANPIYDSAFKYLMEDTAIARGIIGRIIGKEIIELEFRPQEYIATTSQEEFRFLRMDFHATILTAENEKRKVLIELQKSKNTVDLFRFRKYIGEQYQRFDNVVVGRNLKGERVDNPEFYSIIIIYFLGYIEDGNFPKVVKVKNQYYDVLAGKEINGQKSEFIEKLTLESYMLQLAMPPVSITEKPLERILTLFSRTDYHSRVIEYPDNQPEDIQTDSLVQGSIRRLSRAIQDEQVKKQLEFEEEMESKVQNLFRSIETSNAELQKAREELQEKDHTIQEKEKTIQEKEKLLSSMIQLLKDSGMSEEEIQKKLGL
jgi:hypothetical protein